MTCAVVVRCTAGWVHGSGVAKRYLALSGLVVWGNGAFVVIVAREWARQKQGRRNSHAGKER